MFAIRFADGNYYVEMLGADWLTSPSPRDAAVFRTRAAALSRARAGGLAVVFTTIVDLDGVVEECAGGHLVAAELLY